MYFLNIQLILTKKWMQKIDKTLYAKVSFIVKTTPEIFLPFFRVLIHLYKEINERIDL